VLRTAASRHRVIAGHDGQATRERARLAAAQADLAELKAAQLRGELVETAVVEIEWLSVVRTIRAGMLAVPSRVSARLPHLSKHDVVEIDEEIRAVLRNRRGPDAREHFRLDKKARSS